MIKKKIFIHIGHGKTGSTALQCFLAQNYNNLLNNDILYHNPNSIEFNNALAYKINSGNINPTGNWVEDKIFPIIESNSKYNKFLFSNENLFHNLRPLLKILRSSKKSELYEFVIILVVRNPSEMIISEYNQNVKREGAHYSLEEFLEKKKYICTHTKKASKIIKQFENLSCKYHLLNYSKERFEIVNSISKVLGISDYCNHKNIKVKIINRSLTHNEINIVRLINKVYGINIGSKVSDRFVNEIQNISQINETKLDKKTLKKIREINLRYTRIINRRLTKENHLKFEIFHTKENDKLISRDHEKIVFEEIKQKIKSSNILESKSQKKILIIAMGPVHEELAPTYIELSKKNSLLPCFWLHPDSLSKKGDVFSYKKRTYNNEYEVNYAALQSKDGKEKLHKYIDENNIKEIIFLTLQDPWSVNYANQLMQTYGIKCSGIIHNVNKLKNEIVKNFWETEKASAFTLGEHVSRKLNNSLGIKSKVITSVFNPDYKSQFNLIESKILNKRNFIICLLGGVNFQSRDYLSLIKAIKEIDLVLKQKLKIKVVGGGNDRGKLENIVKENYLNSNFEFIKTSSNNGRVEYKSYYEAIKESNGVLILDSPKNVYSTLKITSSIPSAISFLKPLIMSNNLKDVYKLDYRFVFSGSNIKSALENFLKNSSKNIYYKQDIFNYRKTILEINNLNFSN